MVIVVLALFAGCSGSNKEDVMLIPKTTSYHTEECDKVMMAKTERSTRDEALKRNFKPCPYCKPDLP